MKRKPKVRNHYLIEFNWCVGDNIDRPRRWLERRGYEVERVPQLTALHVQRPEGLPFAAFKQDLRALLQPQRGSLTLASSSGRIWSCNNRGNRSGEFVRIF